MAVLNVRLEAGTLPDFRGRVRLEVRVVEAADGERLQILVRPTEEGTMPGASDLRILTDVLAELDEVQAIAVWRPDGSVKPLVGELFATTNVAGRPILLSAASFFQTNLELLGRLITRLQEEVDRHAGRRSGEYLPRVADIYGGVGIFGLFLVERAGDVVIVESDPLAVEAGRLTAERWGLSNVRFVEAAAEEALEDAGGYDVVILDPPRSGLSPAVAEALVESRPPLILYVSCLAQSLARDLKIFLEAGYEVEHLELFDFYPQTYHVELLAVLRLPWPFPP
jgi:tRNA/tmRNA/rRNA uracil-C5-methylase (TrmA/RlmC/RlmD family)